MLALYNRSSKVNPRNNGKNRLLSPSLPSTRFLHAMSESQDAPSLFPMGGKHEEAAPQPGISRAMSLHGLYFAAESEHAL